MLLVVGMWLAVIAPVLLIVTVISGDNGFGWFVIGASTVGLLCVGGDAVLQRGRRDAESDAASVGPGTSRPKHRSHDASADDEDHAEPQLVQHEEVLRPDIWPPVHATHNASTDVEPELVQQEGALRPDIWPPVHPTHDAPSDRDQADPKLAHPEGAPQPDIWPRAPDRA